MVSVDPGLVPQMAPDQIAELVIEQIHQMEEIAGQVLRPPRVLSMTATTAAGVSRLEPNAGRPDNLAADDIQWLVRAEGTFTTLRGRVGANLPVVATGFFVVSDATGDIVGFGFP